VTVSFNTFQAGQDDSQEDNDAFSAENGDVEVLDQRNFTEEDSDDAEYRLLPSDLNLELYLASGDEVDGLEADEDDRLDLSDLNEVDVATLVLNEGWTGDASTAVAPADADISNVDELHEASTAGSAVAEDDQLIIGVEVSGVFGYLDGLNENELGDYLGLEIEQANPAQYDSPNEIDDFEVIVDSENDQIFFVISTEDEGLEAGEEYDVTFTVEGDYVEYYTDHDADEEATTAFSVVDREIEVTGDFDDEEILQIENSNEANVTGESTAAPGTDVQVRLRATGEDPFLMSQTVEVQDDGTIDAEFDLSEHQAGQDFTVRMTDGNDSDVRDEVDAILTESHEGQTPHSVVIHVEDADGNAVSGAEISVDGETATTDDKGKAILELHHGEYKVSASYDGVDANGKLTVDDHSPDEIRLTLGEEDVDYNEKAKDDEKKDADEKGADDEKDIDDEKDADDDGVDDVNGDDAGAPADDQPGFGIAVAILALLAAAGIALRRQ
jgi:pilus assembly protein FimV